MSTWTSTGGTTEVKECVRECDDDAMITTSFLKTRFFGLPVVSIFRWTCPASKSLRVAVQHNNDAFLTSTYSETIGSGN